MDDAQLQLVYRAVVVAKLTYASSSWWGTGASPLHRTGNALKVFCVTADTIRYDAIVEFNVDSKAEYTA